MTQRSHVPKFGSWDKDDIPYTAYFENARREKYGVKMNPNDPEENPEAFMFGRGGMESDADFSFAQTPLHHDSTAAEKHHIEGQHNSKWRNPSDHHKSIASQSPSDHSPLQAGHRREKSDLKTCVATKGSKGFSASVVSRHYRQRSGTHPSDDCHHRAASVPKFGAWDETDPKSGEGFTAIFNRVKAEKQIASAALPSGPPQTRNYSDSQRKRCSYSSRSKFCCCLFSRGSE